MGKQYIASYIMFAKRLERVDEDVDVEVDEEVQPVEEMVMKIPMTVATGGGGTPAVAAPGERRLPLGAAAPCPFFFLELGAGVEEVFPLVGGCQGGGFSSQ